jgi:chromosome segregation ATPase
MGMIKSVIRFITTLGGLLSSKVDEGTDSLTSTPAGVKAAFRQARENWTKQYHEVRDAVSQLMMVIEQKRTEVKKLEQEQEQLEVKKRGAVERFKATRDEKFQTMFQEYHGRLGTVATRLGELNGEIAPLEQQIERYKLKLTEMQNQIANLDKQEAEAIADIVTSKQIVQLNDRMSNLATSLHDENLQAIEKTRQKSKARAKLSDELAGTDRAALDAEVMAAGLTGEAMSEFNQLLAEADLKEKERPGAARPEAERSL